MAYYNYRITGLWYHMPYIEHEDQYAIQPLYLFEPRLPPKIYRQQCFADYHAWCLNEYWLQQDWTTGPEIVWKKISYHWGFYFGIFLTVPLIALPWAISRGWFGFAALVWAFMLLPLLLQVWWWPQYAAPWASIQFLIVVQCIRHLRLWDRHHLRTGKFLVRIC